VVENWEMKKVWEKYKKWQKERKKEFARDLDLLDYELFNFLKLIFKKEGIEERALRRRGNLNEEKFYVLKKIAKSKNYIKCIENIETKKGFYFIEPKGLDFLLDFKKMQKEIKHSNTIKWATMILAISAIVQITNILINNPTTKEFLFKFILAFVEWFFILIEKASFWIFCFLILWFFYKFYIWNKEQ
jgi:hypothetical protein